VKRVTAKEYATLLEFRTELRRFLKWSESQAKGVGLTPAQHQLLLAIKGHPGGEPTVNEIAEYLLLRHHSAVELLNRTAKTGTVERFPDARDGRYMLARLTPDGEAKLAQLTELTLEELRRLTPILDLLTADAEPKATE